jgi:prolyl oligopeptidase
MGAFKEGVCESDPHAHLEVVLGEEPLAWVAERNAACLASVGSPIAESPTYARILGALESKERIPTAYEIGKPGDGRLYNFWQDDTHIQGIWRSCTLASYRTKEPEWTTALDLDALPPPTTGTASTWVWHGSTLLDDGNHDRCLISLSPGGSDADCAREFDLAKNAFVENGFEMSEPAKSDVGWRSRDELLVGTDYGPGSMTDSGYPRVVKSWKRGTPLSEARVVFEGEKLCGIPTDSRYLQLECSGTNFWELSL